jgi:hypothetical protein
MAQNSCWHACICDTKPWKPHLSREAYSGLASQKLSSFCGTRSFADVSTGLQSAGPLFIGCSPMIIQRTAWTNAVSWFRYLSWRHVMVTKDTIIWRLLRYRNQETRHVMVTRRNVMVTKDTITRRLLRYRNQETRHVMVTRDTLHCMASHKPFFHSPATYLCCVAQNQLT